MLWEDWDFIPVKKIIVSKKFEFEIDIWFKFNYFFENVAINLWLSRISNRKFENWYLLNLITFYWQFVFWSKCCDQS